MGGGATGDPLAVLPPRWRDDRVLLGERHRWAVDLCVADDGGVLVVVDRVESRVLLGRGSVAGLVGEWARTHGPAGWMSVPDGTDVAPEVLAALGLTRFSTWDMLTTDRPPDPVPGEREVLLLERGDADEVGECLQAVNPGSSASPVDPASVWWGVRDAGRLVGVVSASPRPGDPAGHDRSTHLRGLAVRPQARGRGLGSALTAAASRAAFDRGTDWVSLGMYTDNDRARRVYERLGLTVAGTFASYGPADATRPPA